MSKDEEAAIDRFGLEEGTDDEFSYHCGAG